MNNDDLKNIYNSVYGDQEEEKFFSKFKGKIDKSGVNEEIKNIVKWKNKKVLDFGCGTGKTSFLLACSGAKVHGLDYSDEAIKLARKRFQHERLSFQEGNLRKINGYYDIIISLGTLEHMDDPSYALKIFKEHLFSNGKIIITCPNCTNTRGFILMTLYYLFNLKITLTDIHYFTPQLIDKIAQGIGLKIEKWWTINYSLGNNQKMIEDLKKRLPKILKKKNDTMKIKKLIAWLKQIQDLDFNSKHSGGTAIYILENK
jgi:2-polyprenyl-3-methyl-5-hydroxy-6-metoxy-1,4-benzoquinol methylase